MDNKLSFSVVIPAFNEADRLLGVFERSLRVLRECSDDFEIIILDDASSDETGFIAEQIQQDYPNIVQVIRHDTNRGIAVTFEELYEAARKDHIFDVPGDGEFPPEALHEIIPLLGEFDVVVCKRRRLRGYTTYRKIVSYFNRLLPRILFRVDLYDPGSAKCRRRELIQEISVSSRGMYVEQERLIRATRRGYRIGMVDVQPDPRPDTSGAGARVNNVCLAMYDLVALWVRLVILRQSP